MWSSYFLCELYLTYELNRVLMPQLMQVVRGYSPRKSVSAGLGNYWLTKQHGADLPMLSHLESEKTCYNIPCRAAAFQHRRVLLLRL
jgi:hypothetical protein